MLATFKSAPTQVLHDSTRLIVLRSAYLTAAAPASLPAGGAAATAACVRILANNNVNNSDRERSHALARVILLSLTRALSHSPLSEQLTYLLLFFVLRVFAKNTRKIIVKFQCQCASVCVRPCVFICSASSTPTTSQAVSQAEGAASHRIASLFVALSSFIHSLSAIRSGSSSARFRSVFRCKIN